MQPTITEKNYPTNIEQPNSEAYESITAINKMNLAKASFTENQNALRNAEQKVLSDKVNSIAAKQKIANATADATHVNAVNDALEKPIASVSNLAPQGQTIDATPLQGGSSVGATNNTPTPQ